MQAPKYLKLTGDGTPHTVSALHVGAKWVTFLADSTNGANALIGGPEVTSSNGFPLVKGSTQYYAGNEAEKMGFYFLDEISYYLGMNDVLHVLYGG